jgi:hypothetical protein
MSTWKELAEQLKVTPQTLSKWRSTEPTCPAESKDVKAWNTWLANRELDGKGSGRVSVDGKTYTAKDIMDLKAKLIAAQERRENANAELRELELKQKKENLIPEKEASEVLIKTLTPLRKLLDAFPRQVASIANPVNPSVAELAIRNTLDERVFAEIEKLIKSWQEKRSK